MSNRRENRALARELKKRADLIEAKKNYLKKQYGQNVFDEVFEEKNYGPIRFVKNGLKAAPSKTWKLWGSMFRINYDYYALAVFGRVFKYRKRVKKGQKKFEVYKYDNGRTG